MSDIAEVAVIGSGPGGGLTACLLAEAGVDVAVYEEGPELPLVESTAYSTGEMAAKYRGGGVTAALGRSQMTYVEARVVGGGSEVNSGLYHRIPEPLFEDWSRKYGWALRPQDLEGAYLQNEADLEVQLMPPHLVPEASRRMDLGAERMGWKCLEVPRWYHNSDTSPHRNSLSCTFIPRAKRAGAAFHARHRVDRIVRDGNAWRIDGVAVSGPFTAQAKSVFVCGGAIQTPALLQRSGLRAGVGRQLYAHPTLKLTTEFADVVNATDSGVPPHQVKEFSPRLSFGCSISRPQFMAIGMLDHPDSLPAVVREWRRHAVYYCMIHGESVGSVRTLPGLREPVVRYHLSNTDAIDLQAGLSRLAHLLFAAGATKLYPSIAGSPFLTRENVDYWGEGIKAETSRLRLSTIHLLGTCPAGENRTLCPVDSFGRVHEATNLFVNDASLICTSLGVNPQGAILAVARRNVNHFLQTIG